MNLIERAKNMIVSPSTEWTVISTEQPNIPTILTGYVIPLAGLAAIAAFIGYGLIGVNMLGFKVAGMNWGLYEALAVFINSIVSVYVTSFIVDALAPSFGSQKNMGRSFQLIAYSYTPVWIGGLLSILPAIALVGIIFGIYGLYLMYIGLPKLKSTPADKQMGYFVVTIIATIIVYFLIGYLLNLILMNIFGLNYGAYRSMPTM